MSYHFSNFKTMTEESCNVECFFQQVAVREIIHAALPLTILSIRHKRKMMSRAIASSVCSPDMPLTKIRSRPNDVRTITASNIC